MSETVEDRVNAVAQALKSVGYDAEARPRLNVVNVRSPADASKMYERVRDAVDGVVDVKMTSAEKFQIDPNPKGKYMEEEDA